MKSKGRKWEWRWTRRPGVEDEHGLFGTANTPCGRVSSNNSLPVIAIVKMGHDDLSLAPEQSTGHLKLPRIWC